MSKPGRNDPCYCGSGKKYKQCHMATDKAAEQERRNQLEAARFLRRDLMKFARDERFSEAFASALPLYWNNLYEIDNAEEMSQNEALRFFDWFVFDYQHGQQPRLIQVYHGELYDDLAVPQQAVLDLWLEAPPAAAYELLDYQGQMLMLRDFMTNDHYEVYEPAGPGDTKPSDLILARLVPVMDRLEFSAVAAYLPQDEIADLAQKLAAAQSADVEAHPESSYHDFMRRHNTLLIHHALEQAERKGRPSVARLNPNRPGKLAQAAARRLKSVGSRQ